jgi:hypothetical protein
MLTYKGGDKVGTGTYWDLSTGERIDVSEEAVLMGGSSSTFYRIPTGVMLLIGPVIGLGYVLLLPFIGIATVCMIAVRKLAAAALSLVGKSLSFGWRPKEAYLAGKKKKERK